MFNLNNRQNNVLTALNVVTVRWFLAERVILQAVNATAKQRN
jgi:hypothetical protein